MLCGRCKIREATVKYTGIVDDVKTEHNLCSYYTKGIDFGRYPALLNEEFPLGKLPSGFLGLEDDEEEIDVRGGVVCSTCSTSLEDFVENSRFGRADYYGAFDLLIKDKMKQLQGSESHKGKHPKYRSTFEKEYPEASRGSGGETKENTDCLTEADSQDLQTAVVRKQIRKLDFKLKETVRQGGYELAASYRDQIRELKKETGIHEQTV